MQKAESWDANSSSEHGQSQSLNMREIFLSNHDENEINLDDAVNISGGYSKHDNNRCRGSSPHARLISLVTSHANPRNNNCRQGSALKRFERGVMLLSMVPSKCTVNWIPRK